MARRMCLFVLLLLLASSGFSLALAGDAPTVLAGIALGEAATKHTKRIRTTTARPLDGAPWLLRMKIVPDKFFADGYVLVGACAEPGRVARIKVRYRDGSMAFFRNVSGEMLTRYGEPAEYKGEVDGRVMGNKWAFSDSRVRPVSLILQHAEGGDPEVGAGTTIKLSNWGLLEAERSCWQERHGGKQTPAASTKTGQDHGYMPQ